MASRDIRAQPVTQKKQRVVLIETFFSPPGGVVTSKDSIVYRYSRDRGSTFRPYNFYSGGVYGFSVSYYPQWYPMADLPEPIEDAHSLDVLYDTCKDYRVTALGPAPFSSEHLSAEYDGSGQLIVHNRFYRRISEMLYRNKVVRNSEGLPIRIYSISIDTTNIVTDTVTVRNIHYDGQNRALSDTLYHRNSSSPDMSYLYNYDHTGKIIRILEASRKPGGQWESYQDQAFSYNALGMVEAHIKRQFQAATGQWLPYSTTSFTYNQQGQLTSSSHDPLTSSTNYYTLHYNGNGPADSFIRYHLNGYVEKTRYFYNSYGNPDSAYTYVFPGGGTASQFNKTVYHYELYEDTIAAAPKGPIIIYPNPAQDKITIRWNERKTAGGVNIRLFSSSGQRVKEIFIQKPAKENTIHIPGLSSGVYYMLITTDGGGKLHTATIAINNDGSR